MSEARSERATSRANATYAAVSNSTCTSPFTISRRCCSCGLSWCEAWRCLLLMLVFHLVIRFQTKKSAGFPRPTPPGLGGRGRRGPRLGSGLGVGIGSCIGFRLGSGLGISIGTSIGIRFGSGIGFSLGSGIGTGLGSSIGISLGSGIGSRLGSGIGSRLGSGLGSRLGSGIGSGLGSSIGTGIGSGLGSGADFSSQTCPPPGAIARLDTGLTRAYPHRRWTAESPWP
jgi:hypothetical protein